MFINDPFAFRMRSRSSSASATILAFRQQYIVILGECPSKSIDLGEHCGVFEEYSPQGRGGMRFNSHGPCRRLCGGQGFAERFVYLPQLGARNS